MSFSFGQDFSCVWKENVPDFWKGTGWKLLKSETEPPQSSERGSGWSANLGFDPQNQIARSQQPQDIFGKVGGVSSNFHKEISVSRRSRCSIRDVRPSPWVTPVALSIL